MKKKNIDNVYFLKQMEKSLIIVSYSWLNFKFLFMYCEVSGHISQKG